MRALECPEHRAEMNTTERSCCSRRAVARVPCCVRVVQALCDAVTQASEVAHRCAQTPAVGRPRRQSAGPPPAC